MNSYKTIIKACTLLLLSALAISCSDSADTQAQNTLDSDPVIVGLSGPTVALSSKEVSAEVGDTFTLDITMSDFPVSEGGGVTVRFDANMLTVSGVVINSEVWNFKSRDGVIDNISGVVPDILFSNYDGVSGDSNVATITFQATNSGSSKINLEGSLINPFASNGEKIAANFIGSDVQIIATSAN